MSSTPVDTEPGAAPARTTRLRWWVELLIIGAMYVVYSSVRNLFGSQGTENVDVSVAFEHAREIIDLQRAMGLYFEATVQQWYLDLPAMGLIRFWNVFYGLAHFVVTAGALIWLFRADKGHYSRWRNTLLLTTVLALVGFASYSLMPPRLLDDPGTYGACQIYAPEAADAAEQGEKNVDGCDRYGYVDTLVVHGGWISFDDERAASVTNQYAAMPSMHIGWSVWSMFVLLRLVKRRSMRILVYAYPWLTLFTIIVTANHYWIDAIGGLATLAAGAALAMWFARWRDRRAVQDVQATGGP
ncbi:MAG: phosphatase PAP2 family protein [Acidimicrobiales bacterium]|nr:phosphatase PAP2 family protein [Acidimicrobiales bacterium]